MCSSSVGRAAAPKGSASRVQIPSTHCRHWPEYTDVSGSVETWTNDPGCTPGRMQEVRREACAPTCQPWDMPMCVLRAGSRPDAAHLYADHSSTGERPGHVALATLGDHV